MQQPSPSDNSFNSFRDKSKRCWKITVEVFESLDAYTKGKDPEYEAARFLPYSRVTIAKAPLLELATRDMRTEIEEVMANDEVRPKPTDNAPTDARG